MHLLAISLFAILAGTLLLAKVKKDELGKFFTYISWFFIVVGFILFIGFIAGGICKMKHHGMPGNPGCQREMMMRGCQDGMHNGSCCPVDMCKRASGEKACCMGHDSTMKSCSGHPAGDTAKMCCPQSKKPGKP